ncbi:MAG: SOS response-associated peptidase [Thiobacillaceae bacterium]
MCGRYVLSTRPEILAAHFGLDEYSDYPPRWNIPPGTDIPVIRQSPEGRRVLHLMRWGLVPHWARDASIGQRLINARAETVAKKAAFREAFRRRRCLIPADGFYEWKTVDKGKQPYYISLRSGQPMGLGGLWEFWRAPDGSVLKTCAIVTTGPNGLLASIHDRMPVIIAPEHWQTWLNGTPEAALALLPPFPAEAMQAWPVHPRASRASEDTSALIEPLPT